MNKRELWLNLANYHFDHLAPTTLWNEIRAKFAGQSPFTLAFADKLSRKLNWKKNFALKAIWEYKKFVFLGITGSSRVTPSKVIDQVWHEHLLFSAGYRQFCKEIIQQDFDHHPELAEIGSQTEAFQAQYAATIELYKREFGIEPPADIWGVTKFPEKDIKEDEKNKWVTDPGTSGDSGSLYTQLSSGEYSDLMYGGGDFGGGGAGSGFDDAGNDDAGGNSDGGSDGGTSCSSSCGSGCGGGD
jgi:hypothetical protein